MTDQANDITAVRTVLFDTLRALSDKENPMDLDRAKAINETAQVIINSAKVETEHLKILGGKGSGFIPNELPAPTQRPALQNLRDRGILDHEERQIKTGTVTQIGNVTQHRAS